MSLQRESGLDLIPQLYRSREGQEHGRRWCQCCWWLWFCFICGVLRHEAPYISLVHTRSEIYYFSLTSQCYGQDLVRKLELLPGLIALRRGIQAARKSRRRRPSTEIMRNRITADLFYYSTRALILHSIQGDREGPILALSFL